MDQDQNNEVQPEPAVDAAQTPQVTQPEAADAAEGEPTAAPQAEVEAAEAPVAEAPDDAEAASDGDQTPAEAEAPEAADAVLAAEADGEPDADAAEAEPEAADEDDAEASVAKAEPAEKPKLTREQQLERLIRGHDRMMQEIRKKIIGQNEVIEELLIVLFAGGHCLISGAPGLAKTLLIRTLADILHLDFKRIQFTPDLMPSDITGTEIIDEDKSGHRELRFIHGPIFTNVLLADEINRTPPKTQAALLEAMEEKQVSIAGETRKLDRPFYVFATQNPIELEGTYPLPEAQMDRFMFKILIDYLDEDQELAVATSTTSEQSEDVQSVFTAEDILSFTELVRMVPVAEPIARYAVRLAQMSRPDNPLAPDFVKKWVSWGAGTRASQYLILGAKARALLNDRLHVSMEDIRHVARPTLRHRILTNFQADADRVGVEDIIDRLLETVKPPASGL